MGVSMYSTKGDTCIVMLLGACSALQRTTLLHGSTDYLPAGRRVL